MAVWDSADQTSRSLQSRRWLAEAVAMLDAGLRRRQAVFEYTQNPACVFRLDVSPIDRALVLRDGTRVVAGQRIARLHFWNEQVPAVPRTGATIAWGRRMQRAIATSLRELASFLAARREFNDVTIICAHAPSGTKNQTEQLARI
ncbi:MAG: YkoP family protein, partial [Steroidobacteraceae bacterium]